MSKNVLGDNPFGGGDAPKPPAPAKSAKPVRKPAKKAKPAKKKAPRPAAKAGAAAEVEAPQTEVEAEALLEGEEAAVEEGEGGSEETFEEAPAVEETPVVEEAQAVEESAAAEEAPVTTETVAAAEPPAVAEMKDAEEVPAVEEPAAADAPPPQADSPPSGGEGGYGPSIDSPGPTGFFRTVVEEVRHVEDRLRGHLGPAKGIAWPVRHRVPLAPIWRRLRWLAMRGRSETVEELGRDERVCARLAPYLELLYRRYFRVQADGLANLPEHGAAILVANHAGILPWDALMLAHGVGTDHAARRVVRPLVDDATFHLPFLGTTLNRLGAVRACPENGARLLGRGEVIAVFPEGGRGVVKPFAERYRLQRFGRGGFVRLALATGAPIVPVAIVGAEESHPLVARLGGVARWLGLPFLPITPTFPLLGPLGLLPLPARWSMKLGAPMYLQAEHGAAAVEDHVLVGRLAEEIRQRVQAMVDEQVGRRRSVFFG